MPMTKKEVPCYDLTQEDIENASVWANMQGLDLKTTFVHPETLSVYNKRSFAKERIILAGAVAQEELHKQWTATGVTELRPDKTLALDEVKLILVSKGLPPGNVI